MSFAAARSSSGLRSKDDPLQPLRAMADRVGKEVEKFAERVDQWHTQGNDDSRAKYHSTLRVVGKFRDLADSAVKDLKKQADTEHKGELDQSVRRRIQTMATTAPRGDNADGASGFQSIVPSIEPFGITSNSSSVQELRHWQTELATWELLRIMMEHQYSEPGADPKADKQARLEKAGGNTRHSPNAEIWDRFLLEDDQAKEKEIVLRWLERTANDSESDIASITAQLEAESGKGTNTWTSGWLDTKSKLKQAKRAQISDQLLPEDTNLRSSEGRELITRLDPDAPGRQKRRLEKSDEYYERALWMVCYEMFRRGVPWSEISEWCKDRNEAWRGVSIGAAYESHSEGRPNIAGQTVGYLFRRMCLYACRGASSPYEAAVYGLLSGDLKEVEPVCRTWDDHLYARYNALLLSRFDEYLTKNHPHRVDPTLAQKFVFRNAVADIGNWETSSSRVIQLLKQQKATAAQSVLPLKLIQGHLISGTVDELVFNVGVALAILLQNDDRPTSLVIDPESSSSNLSSKSPNTERELTAEKEHYILAKDPHALRVLVHVFIVLRKGLGLFDLDDFDHWTAVDNTIAAYIEFLRITKRIQLIPLYAAQLDGDRPVHCLARIIPDVKNSEEQNRMIGLMHQYRIDPSSVISQNFVVTVARVCAEDPSRRISKYEILEPIDHYLWPGQCVKNSLEGFDVQQDEEDLVEALRWYLHLERDINDTFKSLTAGLEYLLLNGRVGAATQICEELGIETISNLKTEAYCGFAFNFTEPGAEVQDRDIARSIGLAASASGRSSIRPSEIPSQEEHARIVLMLRDVSRTYYALHQLIRIIVLFRDWREEEENLIKTRDQGHKINTKQAKEVFALIQSTMESILLEGLFDNVDADSKLWTIAKIYLPEVIIAYISVVQAAAFFTNREVAVKAMDVATIIADSEQSWLQDVFIEAGRMTELVETLALVSRAMLTLGEHEDKNKKKATTKKRGSRGETLRIWDVNVRN